MAKKILVQGDTTCIETPFDVGLIVSNGDYVDDVTLDISLPLGTTYFSHRVANELNYTIPSSWNGVSIEVPTLPEGNNTLMVCVTISDATAYCSGERCISLDAVKAGELLIENNSGVRCLKGIACCDFNQCETLTTYDSFEIIEIEGVDYLQLCYTDESETQTCREIAMTEIASYLGTAITESPIQGDGSIGDPITLIDGTNNNDILLWNLGLGEWEVGALPSDNDTSYDLSLIDNGGIATIRLSGSDATEDDIEIIGNGDTTVGVLGGQIVVTSIDSNTEYTISGLDNVGVATLRLNDGSTNQDIEFVGAGGASVAFTGGQFVVSAGAGDGNTTYDLSGLDNGGVATLRLTGSDATNDDVEIVGIGGSTVGFTSGQIVVDSEQVTDFLLTENGVLEPVLRIVTSGGNFDVLIEELANEVENFATIATVGAIEGSGAVGNPVKLIDGTSDNDVLLWTTGTSEWVVGSIPLATTYDLLTVDSTGDVILRLDPSVGANDDVLISSGTNVSFSGISGTGFTINSENTEYTISAIDNGGTATIRLNDGSTNQDIEIIGANDTSVSVVGGQIVVETDVATQWISGVFRGFYNGNIINDFELTNACGVLTLDTATAAKDGITHSVPSGVLVTLNGTVSGDPTEVFDIDIMFHNSGSPVVQQNFSSDGNLRSFTWHGLLPQNEILYVRLGTDGSASGTVDIYINGYANYCIPL